VAADILEAGDADLVGLARPLIADPTWLSKARLGRSAEIRPCTAVNACINALLDEEPIHCMVNAELGREGTVEESALGRGRTAVVVGGGPGGIEAARRLSARGFRVVLLEQDDALGGQVRAWSSGPARSEVRQILVWWHDDLRRRGVDVRLGAAATVAAVLEQSPSLVVLATGARPIPHPVGVGTAGGAEAAAGAGPSVVDAVTAFAGVSGRHVLVVDEMGRADALLLADALAAAGPAGRRVTLVTTCLHPGEDEGITTLYPLLRSLGRAGVDLVERHRWVGCDGSDVHLVNVFDGFPRVLPDVDVVVPWCGAAPVVDLAGALQDSGVPVRVIGDALLPRRVADAVREGAEVAWSLTPPGGRAAPVG
jgi:NADPH-dependent 2,4-dienoyl-CoA reductase/sulfur reductase-like enzyme